MRSTTYGFSGGLTGGASSSVNLNISSQDSSTRSVTYSTNEYTIENGQGNNNAQWTWDSKVEEHLCEFLPSHVPCSGTTSPWDSSHIVNKNNRFTAISYLNFVPSFQAIYNYLR